MPLRTFPLISVIVPVYKVELYLKRCIESIIKQTYTNLEIILVDDGSPDRCPEICDEYAKKDDRIKVIHKINGGLSSARNAGLDIITGKFITFVDSDDFIQEQFIAHLYNLIEIYSADIAQCSYINRGSDSIFPQVRIKEKINCFNNRSVFLEYKSVIGVQSKLYKTNLWTNIRMPLNKINEDEFTTWKLYYNSSKIVVTNLPLYYLYRNPTSIMATLKTDLKMDFVQAYDERMTYFSNINDKSLFTISNGLFCLTLMLIYLDTVKNESNNKKLSEIYKLFRGNVNEIINNSLIPLNHRVLFFLFRNYPNSCRWVVQIFKLR